MTKVELKMLNYKSGGDVGKLENWHFKGLASNYMITSGTPVASGRIDRGGVGYTWRSGIWRCTAGTFICNELGDEMQTILAGKLCLTFADGAIHEFGPGDTFFTNQGDRVTWDILEDVTKVFHTVKPDGF